MTRLLSLALAAAMFLGVASLAAPSLAQDRPERAAYSAETSPPARASFQTRETRQAPARATTPSRADDNRLSPQLQRALESGDASRVARYLPSRTGPASGGGMTATEIGVNPQAHICEEGNCACLGAFDCVAMVDAGICEEGTMVCNANGCLCSEASGDD